MANRGPTLAQRARTEAWHEQGYEWKRAVFTVPDDVSDERVTLAAYKYERRFGNYLESQGFEVLKMGRPKKDSMDLPLDGDRKRYRILAIVRRKPFLFTIDVPDYEVPGLVAAGAILKE